jgi:glyceraldehyde-3-phosphate dehydrogenase (NADP+)
MNVTEHIASIFPEERKVPQESAAEGALSVTDALCVFTIRTLAATKETDANKAIITNIVRKHKSNFLSTDFIL